jgi:hypothetical protein
MRLRFFPSVAFLAILCHLPPAIAQCPPQVAACTPANAPGSPNYDDSVTDLAYRPGLHQVWAIEGPIPSFNGLRNSRITAFSEDLGTLIGTFTPSFTERAFGIAEIPEGWPNAGKCFVLAPFDTAGDLAIATMEDDGTLMAGTTFIKVIDPNTGQSPNGTYTSMDVHPSQQEIALFDIELGQILFVAPPAGDGEPFNVIRGPFKMEGLPLYFGGGVAYNSDTTVLILAQFRSSFEGHLAMEYRIDSGTYTGNSIVLAHPAGPLDDPFIPLGLDTGSLSGDPVIFFYDAFKDAIYAVPFDQADAPGPVDDLSPRCEVDPTNDGRVRLTWTNNPDYTYQSIQVIENGVTVAVLPATASEFISASAPRGKYEYCLETLGGGKENVIRVCCEGQSGGQLPFLPADELPGSEVVIDPIPNVSHFQLGLASRKVVASKDDFKVYIIGTYDNQVRVVDHNRQSPPVITIPTNPDEAPKLTTVANGFIQDFAATGIALIDLTIQGQKVPMYALLDGDGPTGNDPPSASIHYLEDTTLPGGGAPIPAGTRFQDEITSIDFKGTQNFALFDWDSDAAGNFIAVDYNGRRIFKFAYDPAANTIALADSADVPLNDMPALPKGFGGLGAITVLPSGYYLLAGDQLPGSTVSRAYLLTPFNDKDPSLSARFIGPIDGLWTYSQFFPYGAVGRWQGPDISFGMTATYFEAEGVGAMYYDLPHFRATPRLNFRGNLLVGLTSYLAHPDLAAEGLWDDSSSVSAGGSLDTGPLSPSFADRAPRLDFHYHIYNASSAGNLALKVHVLLDSLEDTQFTETVSIPPGQDLYRVAGDRSEKSIQVRAESIGPGSPVARLLVGVTGLVAGAAAPKFRRGDADPNGVVELTDAVAILGYLFLAGTLSCPDAADVDDTGVIELTDVVYLLNWLFLAGADIPAPGPSACGPDPTADDTLSACISSGCP